jgi:hypothetical protein
MVKMNLKHMYISHCPASEATLKASSKDLNEYCNKMKENGKEHGFDVIFWGNPWGVVESYTFVTTSDKSLDKYVEWRGAWSQVAQKAKLPRYFPESNTTIVTAF